MGLYTFLYGNSLYRLYTTGIQPPLLVPARLSRYTAHTAHTAIQPYTPYIIQRHTASLWSRNVLNLSFTPVSPANLAEQPNCCLKAGSKRASPSSESTSPRLPFSYYYSPTTHNPRTTIVLGTVQVRRLIELRALLRNGRAAPPVSRARNTCVHTNMKTLETTH